MRERRIHNEKKKNIQNKYILIEVMNLEKYKKFDSIYKMQICTDNFQNCTNKYNHASIIWDIYEDNTSLIWK